MELGNLFYAPVIKIFHRPPFCLENCIYVAWRNAKIHNSSQIFCLERVRREAITPLVRRLSRRALIGRKTATSYPVDFLTACCMLVLVFV